MSFITAYAGGWFVGIVNLFPFLFFLFISSLSSHLLLSRKFFIDVPRL